MKTKSFLFCLAVILITSLNANSNDWGIGLRLGDPNAITLKKYMGGSALEFCVGRTHTLSGKGYYDNRFNDWYRDKNFGYSVYNYHSYKRSIPISAQVHYLIHNSIDNIGDEDISGLDWYYGFGGQLRFQNYTYYYSYQQFGDFRWYDATEQVTDIDIGVDGIIGLEYTFDDAPLSLFLDVNVFVEILDNPFLFWGQGGIGARYRF